ncbi:hypothetical protein SDC9_104347 [bioreactor metagenome]|uniref:Uncharacterized protein n=1 Tax=bioreactor metagenome TaxID=1076179 RepID=A0A645AWA0_9ZZZZ
MSDIFTPTVASAFERLIVCPTSTCPDTVESNVSVVERPTASIPAGVSVVLIQSLLMKILLCTADVKLLLTFSSKDTIVCISFKVIRF